MSFYRIQPQIWLWLKTTVHLETSSTELIATDRWMMIDLFKKNGTAVNMALVSLPQNGIERLIHADSHNLLRNAESNRAFHLVYATFILTILKQKRSIAEEPSNGFKVRLLSENLNRK